MRLETGEVQRREPRFSSGRLCPRPVRLSVFSFPEGGAAQAVLSVHLSVPITHLSCKGHRVRLLFQLELLGELEAAAARVFAGDADAALLSQVAAPTPAKLQVMI